MKAKPNFKKYFKEIEEKVKIAYAIAEEARKKGLDPVNIVEIPLTKGLAERVTGIVSVLHPQVKDKKIEDRIRELEKEYGFLELGVALKIAEEVAKQKFCRFSSHLEAMEAGIRLGIAYLTLGIVSSPIEGFIKLEIRKTKNGEDYIAAYFAGPIRSAGGTAAALSVVIIDYLRKIFGYAKYDATKEEVKRAITEIYDYHERIANLQYLPSEKEIEIISSNLPVQVEGEASEDKEVSNYKDLDRISTNKIRSGFCLVIAEGIAQKAQKILKKIKKIKEQGIDIEEDWIFLEKLKKDEKKEEKKENIEKDENIAEDIKIKKESEIESEYKLEISPSNIYIRDIVAGRPILSHPSAEGGFRVRYGRTRVSGYSATAVHPALMKVLDDFLAIGTQLRTERPGKSSGLSVCDYIEGPTVKLEDGSVINIKDVRTAEKLKEKIIEIIYLGDILISYGDFFNRNHVLVPSAYVEEWWWAELKEKLYEIINNSKNFEEVKKAEEILKELDNFNYFNLDFKKALKISKDFKVPLYPLFVFKWKAISKHILEEIFDWLEKGFFNNNLDLILPYSRIEREKKEVKIAKRAFELIALPHLVVLDNVVVKKEQAFALLLNLGLVKIEEVIDILEGKLNNESIHLKKRVEKIKDKLNEIFNNSNSILDVLNKLSEIEIKDTLGCFIGARMGRPEKAKPRVMIGQPHVLFPVGEEGGRLRSFNAALEKGYVKAEFPVYYCNRCQRETIYFLCEECGSETEKKFWCEGCGRLFSNPVCKVHGKLKDYRKKKIDIRYYIEKAMGKLNLSKSEIPILIKGVRGTSSSSHITENLAKGILRAIYNLPVNKDGTIRYDATELPLTHFKPKEIGTSIEKLKELGYTHDIYGNPLENEDQILFLMPQDVILPGAIADEPADKFLIKVAKFVDALLVRFYNLKPFYEVETKDDLIGHLVLCIAPHNAAATVARIIGFSQTQALFASPFLHGALRRDCDGDEAGFMLLLDALINFSLRYLPAHRGGTQDCPVIINVIIKQNEVDDMVFDIESVDEFPKEFFELTLKYKPPHEIKIKQVKDFLETEDSFIIDFTHPVSDINLGNKCSSYKKLTTMQEKVEKQMSVGEKIRAVDASDLARLIIIRHFIRDIRGNLRKFSMQQFRCVQCNEKYRRPPLIGKCIKCGGRIIFTIAEGTIKKYLEPALALAEKYNVPDYVKQSLRLIKSNIEDIFGKEESKQVSLDKWFKRKE